MARLRPSDYAAAVFALRSATSDIKLACRVVARSVIIEKMNGPSSSFGLRRGSLRPPLRYERRLVEAAGVEPASENIPLKHLHTYPEI